MDFKEKRIEEKRREEKRRVEKRREEEKEGTSNNELKKNVDGCSSIFSGCH